jgi:hypothetical protein
MHDMRNYFDFHCKRNPLPRGSILSRVIERSERVAGILRSLSIQVKSSIVKLFKSIGDSTQISNYPHSPRLLSNAKMSDLIQLGPRQGQDDATVCNKPDENQYPQV